MLSMDSSASSRRTALAPLWVVALVALEAGATLLLHRLGSVTGLRFPAGGTGAWVDWLRYGNPVDVLAAVTRVAGLATSWWLLVSTTLYWAASLARSAAAVRAAGWVTPPIVRRCVDGMVAVSLAGVLAGGRTGVAWARSPLSPPAGRATGLPAPAGNPPVGSRVVLPADLEAGIVFLPTGDVVSGGNPAPATLLPALPLPAIPPSPSEAALMPPKATAGVQAQEPPEASGPPGAPLPAGGARGGTAEPQATLRVVQPGDSLWTIAAGHVAPGRQVAPYWLEVVEANRVAIASGDPDLIHPGESVTLPPIDEEGT
jgi:resuscitation-promoting factor RpfA